MTVKTSQQLEHDAVYANGSAKLGRSEWLRKAMDACLQTAAPQTGLGHSNKSGDIRTDYESSTTLFALTSVPTSARMFAVQLLRLGHHEHQPSHSAIDDSLFMDRMARWMKRLIPTGLHSASGYTNGRGRTHVLNVKSSASCGLSYGKYSH